jgi:hypothetical protein
MVYELWDVETRNLVGDYRSRDDALRVVRSAFESYGRDAVRRLALSVEDNSGITSPIAEGDALIDLALGDNSFARPAN